MTHNQDWTDGHGAYRCCYIKLLPGLLIIVLLFLTRAPYVNNAYHLRSAHLRGEALARSHGTVPSEEKIRREAPMMRFIEQHTSVRTPHILYCAITAESLGPFITRVHRERLVDALNIPGRSDDERPIQDPTITERRVAGLPTSVGIPKLIYSERMKIHRITG
ncbi:uncharacterized protein BDW43DRAFT_278190 [Aspergillus alliaceus]|uniref:uncharacterized protein n=1 Tax=Petromyces alliaceus TaxID=209559 RepID=UPI0012A43F84|nr:uncharacterized protein BDW43DRAFT_278190 [Aspergillus alliaceus]KAB8232994.1 hypothetical protein BDW43DRAFT_278190 [Aspergillus alliaceus]